MKNYAFHCVNSAQLAVPKELWHFLLASGSLVGYAELWYPLSVAGSLGQWAGRRPCTSVSACLLALVPWAGLSAAARGRHRSDLCNVQVSSCCLPACHPVMLVLHVWSRGRNWSTWGSKALWHPVPFVGSLKWNHRNLPEDWFIFNELGL